MATPAYPTPSGTVLKPKSRPLAGRLCYDARMTDFDAYEYLLESQDGLCALCGGLDFGVNLAEDEYFDLLLDYDHGHCGTGKVCRECVRGLVCMPCLRDIRKWEHSPRAAELFGEYLLQRPLIGVSE